MRHAIKTLGDPPRILEAALRVEQSATEIIAHRRTAQVMADAREHFAAVQARARDADRAEFLLAILAEIIGRRMGEVHSLLMPAPVEDEYGVARDATDQQKAVRHDMIRKLFLT